ncbi:MAG: hypothetical protein KC492_44515 [Myxococcales bacterium]|nr:hypothetical protein [Myxococcales bacterium]
MLLPEPEFSGHCVACLVCGNRGPILATHAEACDAWNALPRREDSDALREQVRELADLLAELHPDQSQAYGRLWAIGSASTPEEIEWTARRRAALAKLEGGES